MSIEADHKYTAVKRKHYGRFVWEAFIEQSKGDVYVGPFFSKEEVDEAYHAGVGDLYREQTR